MWPINRWNDGLWAVSRLPQSYLFAHSISDSRPDAPPDYQDYFQHRIDVAAAEGMEGLVEPTISRWFTPESVANNIPVLDKGSDNDPTDGSDRTCGLL